MNAKVLFLVICLASAILYATKVFKNFRGTISLRSKRFLLCVFRCLTAVRVKGGMSFRNGMWHGVRNGIIMRNTIYVRNKLTEERVMFSRQFYKSSRLDYQPLFGKMSPHSSPRKDSLRGGSQTGPVRRRKSSL